MNTNGHESGYGEEGDGGEGDGGEARKECVIYMEEEGREMR